MRPHRQQPTRLPCPWDSPGKNTGVGCHFLLQCMKVKSESEVAQSCPTLRHPMDCSLPGSSIHGIFQAKVLEWGAIAFSEVNPRSSYSTNLTQTLDDFKTHTHTFLSILLLLLLLSCFSRVRLYVTPETAAHQAPPSLGFSRQKQWSGFPFPSPVHESEK